MPLSLSINDPAPIGSAPNFRDSDVYFQFKSIHFNDFAHEIDRESDYEIDKEGNHEKKRRSDSRASSFSPVLNEHIRPRT